MLIESFFKSLKNLTLPGILRVFLLSVVLYGVFLTLFVIGVKALVVWLTIGQGVGVSWFASFIGGVGAFMVAWFFFPLFFPLLVSFFSDSIAEAIEKSDYAEEMTPAPPYWPTLTQEMSFTLKALGLNILCIPFYFIPLVNYCVYLGLNGYLLGMQFFRMGAGRYVSRAEAEKMLIKARTEIFIGGVLISFCATVPILNLAAPVIGIATMLHFFHKLRAA